MNSGGDIYGWGVFDIPIERDVSSGRSRGARQLVLSFMLTLLCLGALLLLGRIPPEPPISPEPQPVEIAVRILEEVPTVPPREVEEIPPPAPEKKVVVIPEEPSVPPAPVPKKTVQTAPPEPEPIQVQPPPADLQLPAPSSLRPAPVQPPQERAVLPEQEERVVARQEPVLPEPSRTPYTPRSEPVSVSLPERKADLRKEAASIDLGAGPRTASVAERGTAAGALPQTPAIDLEHTDGTDLGGAAPRMNDRYADRTESTGMPIPAPQRTIVPEGGGEVDILPRATAFASPSSRETVAILPTSDRGDTSFGGIGRKADADLAGPAVRKASLPHEGPVGKPSGESFDFLDLVEPANLDRSVMVNLNQLQTCLDPEEELTLKTRLAAMLSHPDQCRSGGVVFDIRQPESAYSIHIDLYNYERREFQDRCSALRLAVQSCEVRRSNR